LTLQASSKPLLGYTDTFSVENGQPIAFKVSSALPGRYRAEIVRLRCADHTGVGLKQTPVATSINGEYVARFQPVYAGSSVEVSAAEAFDIPRVTLQVYVWPTTPLKGRQALLGTWEDTSGRGYALILDDTGALALLVGDGVRRQLISTQVPLLTRHWYLVAASFDAALGEAWVGQRPLVRYARGDTTAECQAPLAVQPAAGAAFRMAAWNIQVSDGPHAGRVVAGGFYNGKLEEPVVASRCLTAPGFDVSTYYERTPESFDPRVAFIFAGIGTTERIGDFGLIGGGAAGWEIDRADRALGTPPHALVVATATQFSSAYHWVKEELTHTHSANTGETCPLVRCDMVFYETTNGGAVFSTSSIAWAGALAHNGYQNNVSRLTENVLRRFLDAAPF
jgi:hypothetical protein